MFDLIGQATRVVAAAFTVNANNLQKKLRPPGQAAMQKRPKYQNIARTRIFYEFTGYNWVGFRTP